MNATAQRFSLILVSVLFLIALIVMTASASTTISTNISTDGTLSVTGASTLTGLTSMIQASSTRLSVFNNAYFGGTATSTFNSAGVLTLITPLAVTSGGTGVTATSSLGIAISDTIGTLTVARGGTGQTSFGQGWLHSDGTTFTASTSPTVNYITATSTTATSTFAGVFAIGTTSPSSSSLFTVGTSSPLFVVDKNSGNITFSDSAGNNILILDAN